MQENEKDKSRCEVKLLIDNAHWKQIEAIITRSVEEKKREVWFFETPDLMLKNHELVLRVRISRKKSEVESTSKLRKWVSPYPEVLKEWNSVKGFKAEIDATDEDSVPAWSVTRGKIKLSVFEDARRDPLQTAKLFNSNQLLLVRSAWPDLPIKSLQCLGPIESSRWMLENEISIERWSVKNDHVIEISKRGADVKTGLNEIRKLLKQSGIESEPLPGGKTAWALDRLGQSQ